MFIEQCSSSAWPVALSALRPTASLCIVAGILRLTHAWGRFVDIIQLDGSEGRAKPATKLTSKERERVRNLRTEMAALEKLLESKFKR